MFGKSSKIHENKILAKVEKCHYPCLTFLIFPQLPRLRIRNIPAKDNSRMSAANKRKQYWKIRLIKRFINLSSHF